MYRRQYTNNLMPTTLELANAEFYQDNFDRSNPRSVINLLPAFIQDQALKISSEIFNKTDEELAKELFPPDGEVPQQHARLKIAFWEEYDLCQRHEADRMDLTRCLGGLVTVSRFRNILASQPHFLAWLLKPPASYTIVLKEIHELSLKNQLEIMKMPIINADGKPNVKLIEAQHRIFQHTDIRLKGSFIQRIEQKSLNVNLEGKAPPIKNNKPLTLDEIESQIAALKARSQALESPEQVKLDAHKIITGEIISDDGARAKK